jgi:hypothetical protein
MEDADDQDAVGLREIEDRVFGALETAQTRTQRVARSAE